MAVTRRQYLVAATVSAAGCNGEPPAPPETRRHRCITTPSGLVECDLIEDLEQRDRPATKP